MICDAIRDELRLDATGGDTALNVKETKEGQIVQEKQFLLFWAAPLIHHYWRGEWLLWLTRSTNDSGFFLVHQRRS